MVKNALTVAQQIIAQDKITCLRVSDRNTIGLRGAHWRALVKMQGVSFKETEGAGGSHGIGKYAPFAVSGLRTVFYWTCYVEGGTEIERFQGKSVLMSHQGDEGETQGTGFYGLKDGCDELKDDEDILECFRLTKEGRPVHGTSLVIAGFDAAREWRRRIAASVVENFFYAIDRGDLTVLMEPESDDDLFEMNQASLGEWFSKLLDGDIDSEDAGEEGGSALKQARAFWETSDSSEPPIEKQDPDLGHCLLWIRVQEGLPSRVAFVRQTGMLVTTQQRNLIRFPGYHDFAALCVFEDPKGNELLRRMENPQHNQFEPDRLPDSEKARGRRALTRIVSWIRSEVRKQAGPPEGSRRTVLRELAAYLPDYAPDEPFEDADRDDAETKEPGFGDRVTLTLKPVRRPAPSLPQDEEHPNGDGDGDGEDVGGAGGAGTGTNGGEGGTGGPGEGEGQGGTGGRGGGRRKRGVPISGVRILSIEDSENCYRLSFRAEGGGVARLELEEAGDSTTIGRDDVRAVSDTVSLDSIPLVKGERMELDITADAPIGDRAWRLSAVPTGGD